MRIFHLPQLLPISIHALRAEGDLFDFYYAGSLNIISIHALRAEGDGCSPMLANAG